jgi:hypothetical protein
MASFKKPVDWDELYPGRFLKAGELRGKKITLTIRDIELDELESDNGKKVKGVISFVEVRKQPARDVRAQALRLDRQAGDAVRRRLER